MAEIDLIASPAPTPIAKPAPAPAPAAPEAPVVVPTAEELKQRTVEQFASMGWGEPPAGALPEVPAGGEPAPAAPAAAPDPAPEAPVVVDEPEAPTADQIIAKTAQATATAVAQAMRTQNGPPQAPAAPPALDLTPEDQDSLRIIQWLEKAEPAKHRGRAAQFLEYLKVVYAYMDGWLKDNPGKEYDANADEHNDFYTSNAFPVTAEMLESAKIDMMVEQKVADRVRPLEMQMSEAESEKKIQEASQTIGANLGRTVLRMVDTAAPELAALLRDAQGNPSFAPENIEAAMAKDPIAHSILDQVVARQLKPMVLELEKTVVPGANYRLDPVNNRVHRQIDGYFRKAERDMAAAPADVQMQDGRQWVSTARMAGMRQEIENSGRSAQDKQQAHNDLNGSYWILTVDHLEELIAHDLAQSAKELILATDSLAQRKYKGGAAASPVTHAAPAPAAMAPTPRPAGAKPRSPSTSAPTDIVTIGQPGTIPGKNFGQEVSKSMFS